MRINNGMLLLKKSLCHYTFFFLQDYVTSQVRAAVQAAARGKAMTAMKGDVDAGDSSMADEPVAETGGATTSQMKDSTMAGHNDEDDWLFLSVHR